MDHGKLLSLHYLFNTPIQRACEETGLVVRAVGGAARASAAPSLPTGSGTRSEPSLLNAGPSCTPS